MLLALSIPIGLDAAETIHASHLPEPDARKLSVHLRPWSAASFADLLLTDPEIASCLQLSPGWSSIAGPPGALPPEPGLESALAEQASAVLSDEAPTRLDVVVAMGEITVADAVAYGNAVLVMVPKTWNAGESIVPAIVRALLASRSKPAAPDPRCGELLLALGEALARAGSYSLASLPPALRPVHDWLERKDAGPALATLVAFVIDSDQPLQARYARLVRVGQPDGASPELAHAAAFLVEAFKDPARARRTPLDLLLAWRDSKGDVFPPVPAALKKALAKPNDPWLAKEPSPGDLAALDLASLRRALDHPASLPSSPPDDLPLDVRLAAAAGLRAAGRGGCAWIGATVPLAVRTGCRGEEKGGFVYARPRPDGGSEIVARALSGEEGPVVRWPRWVLFPQVLPGGKELVFIDGEGIWSMALEPKATPTRIASGSFRHLAPSRNGELLATVRWPVGSVVLLGPAGDTALKVDGRGGIAWVEDDVLLASDGEKLVMASLDGQVVPWPASQACTRSLVFAGTTILAAVAPPCETALMRLSPADGKITRLVRLSRDAVGLALLPEGGLAFGDAEGLWRWSGGETVERIGLGFTPGNG